MSMQRASIFSAIFIDAREMKPLRKRSFLPLSRPEQMTGRKIAGHMVKLIDYAINGDASFLLVSLIRGFAS